MATKRLFFGSLENELSLEEEEAVQQTQPSSLPTDLEDSQTAHKPSQLKSDHDFSQFKKRILSKYKPKIASSHEEQCQSFLEEYFYPGPEDLIAIRKSFIQPCLEKAQQRLANERAFKSSTKSFQLKAARLAKYSSLKAYQLIGSQIASENRAISCVSFCPSICRTEPESFYTGDWNGNCFEWNLQNLHPKRSLLHLDDKISGLTVHSFAHGNSLLACCSFGGSIGICRVKNNQESQMENSFHSQVVKPFQAHQGRCTKVNFHPNGQFLGSVGAADAHLKLWDLERQHPVWVQPAHRNSAFCLDFQCDDSLVATGGLEGVGRVWDLRSGQAIFSLEDTTKEKIHHSKGITSISWSPNGFTVATGGEDGMICIWDVRAMKLAKTILAHTNVITQCKWEALEGNCLYSCGFDGKVQIHGAFDQKVIASMEFSPGAKISGFDVSASGNSLLAVALDKTIKYWKTEKRIE